MLLDTMCNTFGGICFIALLVAILSNALPHPDRTPEENARKLLEDERLARLARERDEVAAGVELWKELMSEAVPEGAAADEAEEVGQETVAALHEKETALEEEIKKLATDREYNRREAERLRLLAAETRRTLEEERERRNRKVRTPLEHELTGWSPVDVWIRGGRLRSLDDRSQVSVREEGYGEEMTWTYRVAGEGTAVDERLWANPAWRRIERALAGHRFLRIYSDGASFPELCMVRDRLAEEGRRYNWYWHDGEELRFVVGSDSKVQ